MLFNTTNGYTIAIDSMQVCVYLYAYHFIMCACIHACVRACSRYVCTCACVLGRLSAHACVCACACACVRACVRAPNALLKVARCRYLVMKQCWRVEPNERPSFKDLANTFETMLRQDVVSRRAWIHSPGGADIMSATLSYKTIYSLRRYVGTFLHNICRPMLV